MKSFIANEKFGLPLVILPERDEGSPERLIDWWNGLGNWIDERLHEHGALLFRGFGIDSEAVLQDLVRAVGSEAANYFDGNSPRTKVSSGVYTSTEYPAEYFISMHNELSYSNQWPARAFFCCATPPQEGGETPLVDSRRLLRELPAELTEEFRDKGVTYIRNLHGGRGYGRSWMETFETTERTVVEEHASRSGMAVDWLDDGSVRLRNTRPGTARHPVTGDEVWFNQADQFHPSTNAPDVYQAMLALFKGREDRMPQFVTFGDGSEISVEALETIRDTTRRLLVLEPWQRGDLVLADNMLVAHGRMPFKGPRKVLVSLADFIRAEEGFEVGGLGIGAG